MEPAHRYDTRWCMTLQGVDDLCWHCMMYDVCCSTNATTSGPGSNTKWYMLVTKRTQNVSGSFVIVNHTSCSVCVYCVYVLCCMCVCTARVVWRQYGCASSECLCMRVCVCALYGVVMLQSNSGRVYRRILPKNVYPDALCLDASQGGYYFREGVHVCARSLYFCKFH